MQNQSYSLMHGANPGEDTAAADDRSGSIDPLQRLQEDNARLRAIVAELLLKNQLLRWRLADIGSPEMQLASPDESDR